MPVIRLHKLCGTKVIILQDVFENGGDHFIKTGELLVHHQGKHTKLESLLNDEDFKEECQAWLRQQKPESRTPRNLKVYIEGTVFPKLTGHIKKDTISEKTC